MVLTAAKLVVRRREREQDDGLGDSRYDCARWAHTKAEMGPAERDALQRSQQDHRMNADQGERERDQYIAHRNVGRGGCGKDQPNVVGD